MKEHPLGTMWWAVLTLRIPELSKLVVGSSGGYFATGFIP